METGDDGRFYDYHYDFNHDGHLDVSEQLLYDEDVYGHGCGGGLYRRTSPQNSGHGLIMLLYVCAIAFELFIAALCAPVGVIMMYFTISLKEKLLR